MKAPSSHRGSLSSILVTPVHRVAARKRSWESTCACRRLEIRMLDPRLAMEGNSLLRVFQRGKSNRIRFGGGKSTLRLVVDRGQDRGPVRPEDCAMEVEKPAAGALCSDQRRLVELSTAEDKVEEGGLHGHWRLLAGLWHWRSSVEKSVPASSERLARSHLRRHLIANARYNRELNRAESNQ